MLTSAIHNFIEFWKQEDEPLDLLETAILTEVLKAADRYATIHWVNDQCTLYGIIDDNDEEKRFIIITNEDYLRLDCRYDLSKKSRKNAYWNRCVYELREDYCRLFKAMKYDFIFLSESRTDEEIAEWSEYTLNYTTGVENPMSFE